MDDNQRESISKKLKFEVRGKQFLLDRTSSGNIDYILGCSALSFHKAIIGISELKAIESVQNIDIAGGLRISKTISSYYILYHLFTSLMLLDERYPLRFYFPTKQIEGRSYVEVEVDENILNSEDETPEQWIEQGKLEQDLSSRINHQNIKGYIKDLRENFGIRNDIKSPFRILHDHFIYHDYENNQTSIPALYEKLNYIRDRAIYRPTNVLNLEGKTIQTSKDVRKEIDNLPNWEEFYSYLKDLYQSIVEEAKDDRRGVFCGFLFKLWFSPIVEDASYLKSIGWTDDDILELKFKNTDRLFFPSFLSQLLEIAEVKRVKEDVNCLWVPLYNVYEDNF
ncbi:hypothetical protein [Brevibacillus dissolubilis]|uniref:hypothetical protein n=1 Tax=Brevibacillus dissolubilis TaxID=1844116 RepID=UPI0011171DD6|nr:hypothetical protein [Brevibacillus dissolubilis]